MFSKVTILFVAAILGFTASASAQSVSEGHRLAQNWCATCHAVEKDVRGPAQDAAPSFLSISQMSSATQISLTAFLMTSHPPMPNLSLTRTEIRDVIAYILSLTDDRN
jgi:cytochrome c